MPLCGEAAAKRTRKVIVSPMRSFATVRRADLESNSVVAPRTIDENAFQQARSMTVCVPRKHTFSQLGNQLPSLLITTQITPEERLQFIGGPVGWQLLIEKLGGACHAICNNESSSRKSVENPAVHRAPFLGYAIRVINHNTSRAINGGHFGVWAKSPGVRAEGRMGFPVLAEDSKFIAFELVWLHSSFNLTFGLPVAAGKAVIGVKAGIWFALGKPVRVGRQTENPRRLAMGIPKPPG